MHWKNDTLIINKPFEREIDLKDTDTIMLIPSFFLGLIYSLIHLKMEWSLLTDYKKEQI